jgi:catechol 2,3-dioxygenase-like lactoylglutathione lyase family enzyme
MGRARFHQASLIVRDMAASLAFYRRLGLDIPEDGVWTTGSGAHHAKAAPEGEVDLEFESRSLARAYNDGFGAERGKVIIDIALESREGVDALWKALLEESVQGLQPPFDGFWGARCAIVEDPDGNPVRLTSPVDPARRSAPPEL